MGWADFYIQKDQEAKKQQERVQAMNNLVQGSEALKTRRPAAGIDPLLANVKTPKRSTAPALPTVTAPQSMGGFRRMDEMQAQDTAAKAAEFEAKHRSRFNQQVTQLNPYDPYDVYEKAKRFGLGSPKPKTAVGKFFERGSQTGTEMATMVDNPYKTSTGNTIADFGADVLGSMAGIIANPGAGAYAAGTSVGGGILRGAEGLTETGLKKVAPKLPGIAQSMVREGAGSLAYEGARALANERDFSGQEAAAAFLGDALFAGALGGIGKGLGKGLDIKTGKVKMDDDVNYDSLFDEVISRNTPETPKAPDSRYDSSVLNQEKKPLLLPETATTPNFELSTPEKAASIIEARRAKMETPSLNRNVDMSALPDKYPLPDVAPERIAAKALVNRAKTGQLMLPGGATKALPEPHTPNWEFGTGYPKEGNLHVDPYGVVRTEPGMPKMLPEGKLSAADRMRQLVDHEVEALRQEGGQGVLPGGLKYNNEGEVIGRFGRQSQNPPWYRKLYAENGGRAPTQEQLRKQAIKNLMEGYDTPVGRQPANAEFLRLTAEQQAGQKMPDEWHALDRSIKEIDTNPEYRGNPDMAAMKADMADRQRALVAAGQKGSLRHNLDSALDSGKQTDFAQSVKPFGKYGKLVTDANGNHTLVGKNGQTIKLRVTTDPGQYSSWNRKDPTITLRQTDRGQFEFDHELMHGMRDLGLITDAEWRKLQGLALARIDIEAVFNEYKAAGIILDRDGLQHEAVARAAQYWRKNGIPGEAKGVMQKIEQFLHDLGRSIGVSKTRAEDVARDVMSGKPLARGEAKATGLAANPFRNDIPDTTDTPEFKEWFGDSKVVGKDGKPLAVYHGTASDFSVFDKSKALDKEGRKLGMGWGKGKFYFTSSPEGAGGAASGAEYFGRGKSQNIMPVYLSVKKSVSADEYMKLVTQKTQTGISRDAAIAQVDKQLKGQGYDGIVDLDNSGSVAVFEPNQIKSVYNQGTWDAGNPDMRMAVPPDWDHTASKTNVTPSDARQKANRTYASVIDDLYQVNQLDNLTQGLNADEKAYVLAQNARQSGGTTKHIVTRELVDPNGNRVGESLKDITKSIPRGKEKDFENYLIYRHAPSWLDQGHEVFPTSEGITSQISRQRAAVYEAQNPQFKALGDRIISWHKQLSQNWLVNTGLISQQQFDAMNRLYPDYVPFQRELTDAESLGGFNRQKGQPVKRAKGSERKIISPIESMIEHADRYVRTARRNSVLRAIDSQITQDPQGLAGLIERIRPDETYTKPNVVNARINGENVRYKINDPDLFKALEALSSKGDEGIIKAARQITRVMKILTTGSNPIFATRNIARDLPMAYIASDTLTNVPGAREVQFAWGILDALASVATGGRYDPKGTYRSFRALGGGSHSSAMAADRNLLAESKASILPGYLDLRHPFRTAGRGLQGVGRGIEMFTNAFETAPRYSEYKRTIAQQGDTAAGRQQGLFNSQDVTVNFSRHGSMAKTPDAFIPYLNAALQGIDKVARIYQKDPLLATMRSLVAVTVPAVGLYLLNKDDPAYNQLSRWTKDNYYCIKMPSGKFLKIAKPREVGVVFGSLVERALQKWDNDDPKAFKGFSEAWTHNYAPPLRSIAAPLTDVATNTSFSGTPIVPGYMEKLEPGLQYDEGTSWPAKKIGEALNVSPKKIDYLTRSYTGVLGELGIPATSGGRGENALQRVGNTLNRAFTADPLYSNNVLNDFYERKDQLDTAYYTYQQTKLKGKDFNVAERKRYTSAATKLSQLSKQIRAVNANTELSYEEKDQQVRALKQRQLDIAGKLL